MEAVRKSVSRKRKSMSVYMIIEAKVKDSQKYDQYISQVPEIVSKNGGHYLVRSNDVIASWGGWNPERIILLEFPSEDHVRRWLSSPEYKAIAPLREAGAETRVVLLEGHASNRF